jgi:hypothetical protein
LRYENTGPHITNFWGLREAAVGVEPTNNGFANRRLRPLGYAAGIEILLILLTIDLFYNKHRRESGFFCNIFSRINVYINRKIGGDGALFLDILARNLLNLRVLLKPSPPCLLSKTEMGAVFSFFL